LARSYGRVFPSIWKDEDFRACSKGGRLMYVFLVSQSDLDQAGVIPLRFRKWSGLLGIPVGEVEELCAELDEARFTVTDFDTEELLVRSLIRRDEVWKQPNVFKSAATSAVGCESARLKSVLLAEVQRLDLSSANGDQRRTQAELLAALEPFGNPSPTPTGPRREPSERPSPAAVAPAESDNSDETGNSAGHKGSRRVPQGIADGTDELRGMGTGIPVPQGFPLTPTPSPRHPAAAGSARPGADGDAPEPEEGEGESLDERNPGAVTALVDSIRAIRPDWSARSVRRTLDDPDVRDRPWPVVREAFTIAARDPETRQPGRLAGDGDWWHAAARICRTVAAGTASPRPPWCEKCDKRTRFLLDEFGQSGHLKCPRCHPDVQKARSA
jgi:hypothetical protein